ncbi:MAG: hypothetical protein MI922_09630 [Bacteroidales bacterium]|nr:hypothetical protein [Bacteroidales bacterium]
MLFEKKYGSIELIDQVPCISWIPNGVMDCESFKTLMQAGISYYEKYMNKYPYLLWLNDARNLKFIGTEEQTWLADFVNEKARINGLKHMAFVLPKNLYGRIAVRIYINNTLQRDKNMLTIKTFKKYDKATDWLTQKVKAKIISS